MNPRLLLPRLRHLAGENKLFSWALGAGALLRLITILGYPGALWFYGDSYVYLGAALRPQPNLSKATGYSFFLRALLPFHSLTLVVTIQHLMGLAVAVMIYVLLRRNGVSKLWSTVATLPQLLDGYIIEDEHMIMTETLFTFLLMVAMLMLLWKPRPGVVEDAGRGPDRRLRGAGADRRRGHARGVPALPAAARLVVEDGARLADGDRVRGRPRWSPRPPTRAGSTTTTAAVSRVRHVAGGGVLPLGPGVVVRQLRGDPADRREAKICPTDAIADRTPPGNFVWENPYIHSSTLNPGFSPVTPASDKLLTDFASARSRSSRSST